jgi:hypothetical protein
MQILATLAIRKVHKLTAVQLESMRNLKSSKQFGFRKGIHFIPQGALLRTKQLFEFELLWESENYIVPSVGPHRHLPALPLGVASS